MSLNDGNTLRHSTRFLVAPQAAQNTSVARTRWRVFDLGQGCCVSAKLDIVPQQIASGELHSALEIQRSWARDARQRKAIDAIVDGLKVSQPARGPINSERPAMNPTFRQTRAAY
jgi:hypothetical protein